MNWLHATVMARKAGINSFVIPHASDAMCSTCHSRWVRGKNIQHQPCANGLAAAIELKTRAPVPPAPPRVGLTRRAALGTCYADHRCGHLPVAVYRFVNDNQVRLCQDHLNMWLDMADDEEIDEPAGLTWLASA